MADQSQQQQPQQQQQLPIQQQTQTQTQPQQMQQAQQQQLQQLQQQPRVSSVGTMSISGMVAPQAPTPQPTLAAATNAMRSQSTPMPQLQVISQPLHGQTYVPQFQGYAQPFMLQNANALAAMQQMNQLNLAMQQQHQQQQQQQQNRAAGGANPGSPGGILSPTASSQMPTHMSLGNGSSIITSSIPGLITQTAVANGNSKAQGNGSKGQSVQNQAQNASAAIASIVAKQPQVLPAQQAGAPPVVLGQIGVFSNQGNPALGNSFVPQCTVSTHQGGLRLNQTQMVNSAGQIITSQPMQSILTSQAIMQAMASLQMQQGIPIATAGGHQQILNPNQSQMPTIFAGQNFLIRAQGPLSTQPITMTSMQAAFAGIKPQQPQPQQQQQAGKQTNVSGKVMLPSVPRTPVTAKIQPSISQPAKLCVPGVPKITKPRPKAVPKTVTSSATATSSSSSAAVRSVAAVTANTTSTTAIVTSLPATTTMVSIPAALPVQVPGSELAPPQLTRVPALPVAEVITQTVQIKSPSESEVEALKPSGSTTSSTTVDSTLKAKIKATVASSSAVPPVVSANTVSLKSSSDSSALPKLSPVLLGDRMTIDDVVLEEKPVISEVVKSSNSISAAMEAAGLVTLVKETKPLTLIEQPPISQPPPVVEKQRAIVKPQILTHIIEGFVIQEGLEPFPVQQSSLLQEFIPPKASQQIVKESEEEGTSCDDEPPTLLSQVDAHLSSSQLSSHQLSSHQSQAHNEKDEHKHSVKLLKCELCQKVAPASTFNSLRFCSLSCSRRHNVGHTRRAGLFKSRGTTRKRKHILGRKNWRVSKGGRLTYAKTSGDNNSNDENNEDSNTAPVGVGDEMSSSNSTRETSSSADSPPRSQEYDMEVDGNIPRTDPGKWTVTEVYDFIQSMPGCREYAEEFRSQEIDGQALLLLKEDHLMTAMNIKLGPALKICSKINSLKNDNAPS